MQNLTDKKLTRNNFGRNGVPKSTMGSLKQKKNQETFKNQKSRLQVGVHFKEDIDSESDECEQARQSIYNEMRQLKSGHPMSSMQRRLV